MSADAALGLCRFLHYLSAMLLWGASAYLWMAVPGNLARDMWRRLFPFLLLMAALAVVTTLVVLPLEAGVIGEGWADAFSVSTIREVLFESTVGQAWQMQAGVALVLVAALVVPFRFRRGAITLAAGCLLASVASTGHAVMHADWEGFAHRLNDVIHVLAAGAWLGALVPLLPILSKLTDPASRADANFALRRFSTAGHIAVALVVATGCANTFFILGRWPMDWSLTYQALLAAKIGLAAVMIGLAITNRYYIVPRIAVQGPRAITAIKVGTVAEIAVGVVILILVSNIGMLEPT